MNVYLAKFMTYFEIHRMHREGRSISKISEFLVVNRRTVSKYLSMDEREYEAFLAKQKVSGQFKTPEGAQIYAVIRSVTDTCAKNGQNVLQAFKTIATLQPE